jgi:hypothetical protein
MTEKYQFWLKSFGRVRCFLVNPKAFAKTLLSAMLMGLSFYVCNFFSKTILAKHFLIFQFKMSSLCPPFLSPSVCWPACPCAMPAVAAVAVAMAVRHNGDDGSGGGDNFDVGIR